MPSAEEKQLEEEEDFGTEQEELTSERLQSVVEGIRETTRLWCSRRIAEKKLERESKCAVCGDCACGQAQL